MRVPPTTPSPPAEGTRTVKDRAAEPFDPLRSRLFQALFFAWWTVFALAFAHWYHSMAQSRDRPMTWTDAYVLGFVDMYLWALLAVAAFTLARRLPLTRASWRSTLVLHLVLGFAVLVGRLLLEMGIAEVTDAIRKMPLSLKLLLQLPPHAIGYFTLVGVGYALEYYRRYRERETRAAQLQAQLARAELDVLKMQLHPHFLFNTLNAISALMHRDVGEADRMLTRLSDLLRVSLEQAGTQEVSLRDELEFLAPYLEIEQTRFGDRLSVEWTIEPEALDGLVPHLLLQPLIENAIRHGIAPRAAPGRIEIFAHRRNGTLQIEVRDDGRGLGAAKGGQKSTGVGLSNTRARLAQLYDEKHSFRVVGPPEGGVVVAMEIPFRAAQRAAASSANGDG